MNLRKVLWLIVVLFVSENIFFFSFLDIWKEEREKQRQTDESLKRMLGGGISNEGVIFNLLEYIKMDGYVLPDLKLTVYTPKNENKKEERTLHDVLAEGPKIVFKFSQYGCSSCIIEQIEHLKILEQERGYRNIILITDRIPADIARHLRAAKVHFQIFLVDEADLLHEYDKSLIPYVFRTEGTRIVNSMVLSRETLEYSRYFYEQFN